MNRLQTAIIATLSSLIGLLVAIWLFPGFRLIVEYYHPELPLVIALLTFVACYCLTGKK